jgi:hypothetical protein
MSSAAAGGRHGSEMKTSDKQPTETTSSGPDTEPLEELLSHARQDGFTPKETEEVWSRLEAFLVAPGSRGGSSSPAGGSGSGVAGAWAGKTIAVLVLGGAVVVGGGLMVTGVAGLAWHRATPAASNGWRVAAQDEVAAGDRSRASFQSGPAGGAELEPNAGTALASPVTLPAAQPPLASPPRTDSPSRAPGPHRVAPKAEPPRAGLSAVDTSGESTSEAIEAPPSAPVVPPPVAPPASDPGLNEGALLLRARRELESNPAETLKLAEEHSRLFAAGTLVPEREVLAIEALARLGRLSEARARFVDFRARFPQSPHLARLQATVGR